MSRLSDLVRSRICGGVGRRSVLRALADNADAGGQVAMTVPMLAREAEVTDRTVQTHLKAFLAEGLLVRVEQRKIPHGTMTVYALVEATIKALPTVATGEATAPVKTKHRRKAITGENPTPVKVAAEPPPVVERTTEPTISSGEFISPVKEIEEATYTELSLSQETETPEVEEVGVCAREVSLFEPAALPKRKRRANEGSFIDPDWKLDTIDAAYAASKGFVNGSALRLAEAFKNHWLSASGPKARKRDWRAAWRTWVNNEINWRGKPHDEQRTGAAAADPGIRQRPRSRLTQRFNEIQARGEPIDLGRLDSIAVK